MPPFNEERLDQQEGVLRHIVVGLGRGQVDHSDLIAVVGAFMRRDDQPFAVIGHLRGVAELGALGRGVDQRVGRLRGAELVEIDLLVLVQRLELRPGGGRCEARIIEARAILRPGEARNFTHSIVSETAPLATSSTLTVRQSVPPSCTA